MPSSTIHRARALLGMAGAALSLLAAGACENPAEPEPAGITVLSSSGVSDTVMALVSEPLVVVVRDSAGRPLSGVTVRFESSVTGYQSGIVPMAWMSATTPDDYRDVVEAVTDATGRAAVRVRLGVVAGSTAIQITVPTRGFLGTAMYDVLPGAAVRTTVMPRDTAVYAGASYALRVALEDRFGNPRPLAASSATSDAPGIATATATAVTGQAIGRTRIVVTARSENHPVYVSVVPPGTLAAARGDGIYTFGLDGSGYRRVATAQSARSPRWFPDGQRLVFSTGQGHGWVSNLSGAPQPLVQGFSSLAAELWAHPSRDGAWVYFGGYTGAEFRGYPHRVRADGTGLQLVPGFTADGFNQGHPSPSPTGDRVVYFREEGNSRDVVLRILNMQTGQVLVRDVPGHAPEWSHGDSIAYLDMQGGDWGPIRLMSSAGLGRRMVGLGTTYDFGIDWSPTDEWIVARDVESRRLEIIRVATGERIPLPYSEGLYNPAWKP